MSTHDLAALEKILGTQFNNTQLLQQALVHRSYLNEHPRFGVPHNERLEFLGDAVLELIVTDYLYEHFPNPEGELTNWRASLVNAARCAEVATDLGLENFLYLSKGEAKDKNSKARNFILANAVEALIGAIYLDQGYAAAEQFVSTFVITKLDHILKNQLYIDAKTRFQELSQEKMGITPIYRVLKETGPDHNKTFVVGIYLGDELIASGAGSSKQEAQMEAAAAALVKKNW
jgi:ribonuclease III